MADQSNRKIRWGVLGFARIARMSVIPGILRSGNSELYALASRDEAKLAESRTTFGAGHKTVLGYEALLDDPAVDAVYIPLPNSQHREWTVRAAEKGKHVLCEKPMALNAAQCREMIAACAKHRVLLMEAFMYRYTARTRQVVEVWKSGVLGEIKFVQASFRYPMTNPVSIKLKPELGGGALYDVGCYPINLIGLVADLAEGAIAGSVKPESVSAECVLSGGIDVMASALLRYRTGMIAALHCGFNAQKRIHAEIVGTKGALEVPETYFDAAGALNLITGEERREIPVPESDRYRSEVEDFADAILQGRAPQFGLAETLRNAEVLDQVFAASK